MKKKEKNSLRKEEIAEDWCFYCKDGGELLICDYKQCLKAYHPGCVGKDDSFVKTGIRWSCNLHSCFICRRSSYFYCYCCPKAVCKRCIDASEFVQIRGKKGFCTCCLKIALLLEENKDVDSDGEKVDFNDRETYEFLFKEYWALINEKEGLTVENLRFAKARFKKGKNYKSDTDSDDQYTSEEEDQPISDTDVMNYSEDEQKPRRKKSIVRSSPGGKKLKSNKTEFSGWGSKSLIQFLSSIDKNPIEKLSQHDVANIINGYIKENNLFHPQKRKQVICDEKLKSLFGRKIVSKHRIFDLLETHFAENLDSSSEEDFTYVSEEMHGDILLPCKKQRNSNVEKQKISNVEKHSSNVPQNCLASIVAENIKLIYLRRSLVKELSEQSKNFENKVIGSFVRVKSDPNDFIQKNPYQLVQVTGIKKSLAHENDTNIFLQVSSMPKDICISVLSDDDFSEEECEDLRLKVELGLVKKFTVNELEQKARILHEDQTKHWIARELILLQNLIDRANEKGWRRELYEHMERKQLLKSSEEQSRLLQEFPKVILHIDGDEEGSPKSILVSSEIPRDNFKGNGTLSELNQYTEIDYKKEACSEVSIEENKKCPKPSIPVPKDQSTDQEVIEVSSDDEDKDDATGRQKLEDLERSLWYCLCTNGKTVGPHSLSFLKKWSESSSFTLTFRVWKTGQSEEKAIPLGDAVKILG